MWPHPPISIGEIAEIRRAVEVQKAPVSRKTSPKIIKPDAAISLLGKF